MKYLFAACGTLRFLLLAMLAPLCCGSLQLLFFPSVIALWVLSLNVAIALAPIPRKGQRLRFWVHLCLAFAITQALLWAGPHERSARDARVEASKHQCDFNFRDARKRAAWLADRLSVGRQGIRRIQAATTGWEDEEVPGRVSLVIDQSAYAKALEPEKITVSNRAGTSWRDLPQVLEYIREEPTSLDRWASFEFWAGKLIDLDVRRAYEQRVLEQRVFRFVPSTAVSRISETGLQVLLDPGELEAQAVELQEAVERSWLVPPFKLSVKWAKGDPRAFRFVRDPYSLPHFVNRNQREIHLRPSVSVDVIAHELGHVLGFDDHYQNIWDEKDCSSNFIPHSEDLMGWGQYNTVRPGHWRILLEAYPPSPSQPRQLAYLQDEIIVEGDNSIKYMEQHRVFHVLDRQILEKIESSNSWQQLFLSQEGTKLRGVWKKIVVSKRGPQKLEVPVEGRLSRAGNEFLLVAKGWGNPAEEKFFEGELNRGTDGWQIKFFQFGRKAGGEYSTSYWQINLGKKGLPVPTSVSSSVYADSILTQICSYTPRYIALEGEDAKVVLAYYGGSFEQVKGEDPASFVGLTTCKIGDDQFGKDKAKVYFGTEPIEGADPSSFTVLKEKEGKVADAQDHSSYFFGRARIPKSLSLRLTALGFKWLVAEDSGGARVYSRQGQLKRVEGKSAAVRHGYLVDRQRAYDDAGNPIAFGPESVTDVPGLFRKGSTFVFKGEVVEGANFSATPEIGPLLSFYKNEARYWSDGKSIFCNSQRVAEAGPMDVKDGMVEINGWKYRACGDNPLPVSVAQAEVPPPAPLP